MIRFQRKQWMGFGNRKRHFSSVIGPNWISWQINLGRRTLIWATKRMLEDHSTSQFYWRVRPWSRLRSPTARRLWFQRRHKSNLEARYRVEITMRTSGEHWNARLHKVRYRHLRSTGRTIISMRLRHRLFLKSFRSRYRIFAMVRWSKIRRNHLLKISRNSPRKRMLRCASHCCWRARKVQGFKLS